MEPNLVVISDLHLGEDVGRPGSELDHEGPLIAFLRHYAADRRDGRPWRLVINGDMVDFQAMNLTPTEAGVGDLVDPEDHELGLGDSPIAARAKLRVVLERHGAVFDALAAFVGAGNDLVLVPGNHDADWAWPQVREELVESLRQRWAAQRAAGALGRDDASLREAVRFSHWAWYEADLAWIEHGHQYDPYCAFDHPLDPTDSPTRLQSNVSGALLRYVVRRFISQVAEHWNSGFWGYLTWALRRPWADLVGVLSGYGRMCVHLVLQWARRTWAERRARAAVRRGALLSLAQRFRLAPATLERLVELQARPVSADLGRLVRAVMLDRLVVLTTVPFLLLTPQLFAPGLLALGLTLGAVALLVAAVADPPEPADPRPAMREVSRALRSHLRVPLVVFGHTHDPVVEAGWDGWMCNTGTWVPDGAEGGRLRAFTHLVIERSHLGFKAALCRWTDGRSVAFEGHPVAAR